MMSMAATALGSELTWPKPGPALDAAKVAVDKFRESNAQLQSTAEREPANAQKLTPCEQVRLERHEHWMDPKTPPKVGHAVIGLVNGTTKTRAVYYMAKTGKWVDVNDRPVTVTQWRHL